MAKLNLPDLVNITNLSGVATLNDNFDKVGAEFDKVLYTDGSNTLKGTLDLNSNRLINLPDAQSLSEPVNKRQLDSLVSSSVADAIIKAQIGLNLDDLVAELVSQALVLPLANVQGIINTANQAIATANAAAASAAASAAYVQDLINKLPTSPTTPLPVVPMPETTYANITTVFANNKLFSPYLVAVEQRLTALKSVPGNNAVDYGTAPDTSSGDSIYIAFTKLQARITDLETPPVVVVAPTQDNTLAGSIKEFAGNDAWRSRFQALESRFTALGIS